MSGFLRPEAARTLSRWREVLVALGAVGLGLYALTLRGFVLQGAGAVLVLAGLGFAVVGWRRMRFRGAGDAPGAIKITEGQIAYFGPLSGGVMALSLLERLELTGPPRHRWWGLVSETGERLDIPHDAVGAEALFDVFASLPGSAPQTVLRALRSPHGGTQIVWQREAGHRLTLPRPRHSPVS